MDAVLDESPTNGDTERRYRAVGAQQRCAREMKNTIPEKNKSPHGWWVATIVERYEHFDENKANLNRRCTAWMNTVLIKAASRDEAYRKAIAHGKIGTDTICGPEGGRQGHWVFEGLASLLPIYEELEDGAELMWEQAVNIAVKTVKAGVKEKRDLECFQDLDAGSTTNNCPQRR